MPVLLRRAAPLCSAASGSFPAAFRLCGRFAPAGLLCLLLLGLTGAPPALDAIPHPSMPPQPTPGPLLRSITAEPPIRIRLSARLHEVRLSAAVPLELQAQADGRHGTPVVLPAPIHVERIQTSGGPAYRATGSDGRRFLWAAPFLQIRPTQVGEPLIFSQERYPGVLVLAAQQRSPHLFDLINHLPLETYLPGVLEKELYPTWEPQAFRAQAIAARSYALWEMTLPAAAGSTREHFDLESTVASQAYGGLARSQKAIDAVAATRGVVLAWDQRVLPAFYSSCSGGVGQDAVAAFPNRVPDLAPLRGREQGAWGAASNRFRWAPIERDLNTLTRRIADWGRTERHPVAALTGLRRIVVAERNAVGRPTVFSLTDRSGRVFHLSCEFLRFACNHPAPGLPTLAPEQRLPSSFFEPRIRGQRVIFEGGRGFGHGVGMCQWSSQAMAQQQHPAAAILQFFYPGAELVRAY